MLGKHTMLEFGNFCLGIADPHTLSPSYFEQKYHPVNSMYIYIVANCKSIELPLNIFFVRYRRLNTIWFDGAKQTIQEFFFSFRLLSSRKNHHFLLNALWLYTKKNQLGRYYTDKRVSLRSNLCIGQLKLCAHT